MTPKKPKNISGLIKKTKPEENSSEKSADSQIETALSESKIKASQVKLKKLRMKQGGALVALALFGWLGYYLFAPYKATMAFGICKVFTELTVQFPSQLRINSIENFRNSVRIWYTKIDSFGEERLEPIQCYYKADRSNGYVLDKITIRRREIDPDRVTAFNQTIPLLYIYPPDLTYPNSGNSSLEGLHFEVNKYRKSVF